jgi:hypothetical protein
MTCLPRRTFQGSTFFPEHLLDLTCPSFGAPGIIDDTGPTSQPCAFAGTNFRINQCENLPKTLLLNQVSYAVKLLGVDVGFSVRRATTATALLDGNRLHLARAGTAWESRAAQIPSDFRASVIAIDGPLLPQGSDDHIHRVCEAVFIRSRFTTGASPGRVIGGLDCNSDVHLPRPARSSVGYWGPRWKGTETFAMAVPSWRLFRMLSWPC